MKIAIIIVSILAVLALFYFLIGRLNDWLTGKVWKMEKMMRGEEDGEEPLVGEDSPYKQYIGKEHHWKHTYQLSHSGVRVFNLPFTPENNEVFYLENEYDEKANAFIKENKEYICKLFASKGYTFVYLPDVKVSKEAAETMIAYHSPEGNDAGCGPCGRPQ